MVFRSITLIDGIRNTARCTSGVVGVGVKCVWCV